MSNKLKKHQKGFSLIGVIVSIFIISIGLTSLLALTSMSLRGSFLSKDRLVASGLAQEGIEIVRDIRKSHAEWGDWEWYGAIATSTSQDFLVQYNDVSLPERVYSSTTLLKIDENGFYQHTAGSDTSFYRKITLTKISYQEVKVVVEVKWQLKNQWYYLIAEDRLWNWK